MASRKRQLEAEDCADKAVCPVCLDAREEGCRAVRMPCCGQRFHRGCLLTWLSAESDKCPTCRGELPSLSVMDFKRNRGNVREEWPWKRERYYDGRVICRDSDSFPGLESEGDMEYAD